MINGITPMMQQWQHCKEQAEGQLLLFRMGDFYESFYEDAVLLSQALDITLTKRGDVPMSGIPAHSVEGHLERLVSKGLRIAIAEQLEEARPGKGLVKREIVRVITPGTWTGIEEQRAHHYLIAVCQVGSLFGLALLDMTTATFQTTELEKEIDLINEIYRLSPKEIITTQTFAIKHPLCFQDHQALFHLAPHCFEHEMASRSLTTHFAVSHLDGFGLKGMTAAINAAGALLHYVTQTLHLSTDHLTTLSPYAVTTIMALDRATLRNLELVESISPGGPTLLKIVDATLTSMGGRLLRDWIQRPLIDCPQIAQRQESVAFFFCNDSVRSQIRASLRQIQDLERLTTRIASHLASPRDLKALSASLRHFPSLALALQGTPELLTHAQQALGDHSALVPDCKNFHAFDSDFSGQQSAELDGNLTQVVESEHKAGLEKVSQMHENFCSQGLVARIDSALVSEPPARLGEGPLFARGYDETLDALVALTTEGKSWLATYQAHIKEETGIKNLKITFNKVFGYTIEVSRGQAHLLPSTFERRQTLAHAERFVSTALKEYEHRILTAEERILTLEQELFAALVEHIRRVQHELLAAARALAWIDALQSLAEVARKYDYVRPIVDASDLFAIEEGRHPVIEHVMGRHHFIPNNTLLGKEHGRMVLLTGPNMAGKSTYMRQTALIAILAQMGSFVPARTAHLGIVDKIFTRIGASDDLARGQSTFMVEMHETSHILRHATTRSLVILDEIGRGTSTYDGIAIAWAVAEHLLMTPERKAKTLFATHYGELTDLSKHFLEVRHAHAAVDEVDGNIVFQHRIIPGVAHNSYGIHVAKLAGLPSPVIKRAQEILKKFETKKVKQPPEPHAQQLLLF